MGVSFAKPIHRRQGCWRQKARPYAEGDGEKISVTSAKPNCSSRSWNRRVMAAFWWSVRSNLSSKPRWGARWRCRRCTNCCIDITGANLPRIKDTLKAILWLRTTGKKLHETLVEIRQNWAKGDPIRLMFQDEARFGRINDVRRCWAPKPVRPLCQGMLTHEYTYAYAAVEARLC